MTKAGFDADAHKGILVRVLIDVFKSHGANLAFKGGTCAALFYDLPRGSFDLDFDALKPLPQEEARALGTVLSRHGTVREFMDKRNTVFYLLDYAKHAPNVKVEINKRIWVNNSYRPIRFFGVEMRIADETTILTNKIVALADRRAPVARDLFDTYYFLRIGFPLSEALIRERTGKGTAEYLESLIPFIRKNFTPRRVLHGLGDVLTGPQKDWARQDLVRDAVREIEKRLEATR